ERSGGHLRRRIPCEGRSHRLLLRVLGDQRADRRVAQRFGGAMEKPDRVNLPRRSRESQQQRDHTAQRYRHSEGALQPSAIRNPARQRLEQLLADQVERKQKSGLVRLNPKRLYAKIGSAKLMTPKLSRDKNPSAQITRREGETGKRGEWRKGGRGDGGRRLGENSPCPPVPLSPCLLVSLSPCLTLFLLFNRRRQRGFASGVIVNVIGDHPGRVRNAFVSGEVVHVHHVRPAVAFDDVEAV